MTANENGTNGNGNRKGNGLTLKQKVWLEEYLRCWNGAEAARIAGYAHPRQAAYANITKDYILQKIKERLASKTMLADEVLMRLSEQARASAGQFFQYSEDGKSVVVDWESILNGEHSHLVKSITFGREGPKIEVYDAQHALAHLAKYYGLFGESDKLGVEVEVNIVCHEGNVQHTTSPASPEASGDQT